MDGPTDDSPSIASLTDAEMPARGGAVTSPAAYLARRGAARATDASPAAARVCFWKSLPPLSASALYGL